MDLTIVIPTKSRPEFLRRCLTFLNYQKCDYPIIIGDSSNGEDLENNKVSIKSFKNLDIDHVIEDNYLEELKGWQNDKVSYLLQKLIQTKYTCFM